MVFSSHNNGKGNKIIFPYYECSRKIRNMSTIPLIIASVSHRHRAAIATIIEHYDPIGAGTIKIIMVADL